MRREYLDEQLKIYSQSGVYPFHMPGHKRMESALMNPYSLDITEIEGFDNLHEPEGILKKGMERLAALYGAKESYFLVNGSTGGLLSAVSAAVRHGDTVLMARNCHKAVYHAVSLLELKPEYLYPSIMKEGIQGSIRTEEVEKALERNPFVKAVIITSPTYDGILSDIRSIAECVHKRGIPLIVDEAHGAHLGFGGGFPESAVAKGADAVIQSFHKTLPSLTQTAVLHVTGERIDSERLRRYLGIYQTSSPSYLLMASIDRCVRMLETKGTWYFENFRKNLDDFYEKVKKFQYVKVLTKENFSKEEAYDTDPSKILICTESIHMTGTELMSCLREKWKLELEMASGYYALAMTSIMDTEEGFFRLFEALRFLDEEEKRRESISGSSKETEKKSFSFMKELYGEKAAVCPIWEAEERKSEELPFEDAEGRISAETISLYPPGIPMLVPGERIEREFLEKLKECRQKGLCLCGLSGASNETIKVVIS